jgi:hypothetical protein
MNCSKVGLLSFAGLGAGVLALAVAPLGCEDPSTVSPVQLDGGGVFAAEAGDSNVVTPPPPPGSECVPPTKGPTMHGGGSTSDPDNDVWTADTSPHVLPFDTTIYKTVTIEPCAEVLLAGGRQITVRGKLVAEGTATRRIHIGAKDAASPFGNIRTLSPATIRLAYATIDGGGLPLATVPYLAGTLEINGDTLKPVQEVLFVDHVTIGGSKSNGLVVQGNGGFTAGSNALVVTGAAVHPVSVWARAASGIPAGTYTGNGSDKILLPTTSGNETINETTTFHERGVPYLVGHATSAGDLRVDVPMGQPGVTLTIEPGVNVRFKKGGVLKVAVATSTNPARGSLVAAGTAGRPIVFTSDEATPAAGDWLGLWFGDIPTATDKVDQARVEYAGGTSTSGSGSCPDNSELNNDAAIRIFGAPPAEFVTNTTILASATNGVDRGWRSDNAVIEFLPTNTFTNVALCHQTFPPTAANVCPGVVPCPQ